MKTATLTLPRYSFIETAPLAARYEVLAEAVLVFVMAGRLGHALRASRKVVRLIRTLTKLEAHNAQLRRKLDMLSYKPWRDRVLRELGGMRKLELWEAAYQRILTKAATPSQTPKPQEPAWLYTAERMAESEWLKARKREVYRANHNPFIVRDRCKADFEGEFRLAPLPRGERAAWQIKVYTENTIVDYDWNPILFAKEKGFGPASVWPVEFYAAMAIEAGILESPTSHTQSPRPYICEQVQAGDDKSINSGAPSFLSSPRKRGSNPTEPSLTLDPRVREGDKGENAKAGSEGAANDSLTYTFYAPLSLEVVLSRKTYRDLF